MNLPRRSARELPCREAFTRIDLAVLILVVGLGAVVANPLFTSHSRARADTLVCQANLAEIGRGYQLWAGDHEDQNPWFINASEGGLRQHLLAANSYMQFSCISNGVSSPKIFVCPADTNTTRRAKDFSTNPDGGFMHPAYRNNAVSYMVSFHALRYMPRSVLCGDRNIEPVEIVNCAYVTFPCRNVRAQGASAGSQWGQSIHDSKGNLLFNDGSVEETTTAQLRAAVTSNDDVAGSIHVLSPK